MTKYKIITIIIILFISQFVKADEGMWIPILLKKYNIEDMKKKGFKLNAEDIYSVNNASMKDAVMIFGGGCTAELISDKGLIITNHHCGFSRIQAHSSLKNDYLTNGFWAMSNKEELPNPGLTVTFLEYMEDVTKKVLANVNDNMDEAERQMIIAAEIIKIKAEASKNGKFVAKVKPFFYGNEYYLFVSKVYRDVRLVGAPPSSIGKFGGDTDNWMWPRHTGDFSMFRIYADKNNEPANYSPDNIPYKPKKHFPISIKGVKKGDFTLVFGYPGRTQEYLTSYAIKMISKDENPHQIKIRQMKIDVMSNDMNNDPAVRIKYAAKYARVSNYWKKWIGENKGLERLNAIQKKKNFEKKFTKWANSNQNRKNTYGALLPKYKSIYDKLTPYALANAYFYETLYTMEIVRLSSIFVKLTRLYEKSDEKKIKKTVESVRRSVKGFYKDYNKSTDMKIFKQALKMYYDNVDKKFHPALFNLVEKKFKGDFDKYTKYLYKKSFIANEKKVYTFLDKFKLSHIKKIKKDPAYIFYGDALDIYYKEINPKSRELHQKVEKLNRTYVKGQRLMLKDKVFYPDANSTLRVAYGQVDDYKPKDGVKYLHYTTLEGIMEKDNPNIYDYKVPKKLKELFIKKDYGQYAENGQIHVCFTASNHTTGGNSGSPVINGDGHLIGVNFDRCWEGTMSDIMFDPERCRNISIDIRYALFIIDKFAGAGYLLNEMTIIK